jgi:hypothetical protein
MTTASNSNKLDRREVVMRLLRDRRDLIAVSSLGSPTYDLAAAAIMIAISISGVRWAGPSHWLWV